MNPDGVDPAAPCLYSSLVEAAIRLAARGHYHQFRKGRSGAAHRTPIANPLAEDHVPYITHIMGTVCILARLGQPDEVLAAAALHDYLEDVPDPDGQERIRSVAGDRVLELVQAVTEDKRPELAKSRTWELRKREQLDRLESIPEAAVVIKCADLLHNLSSLEIDLAAVDPQSTVWDRFNADRERQIWYYTGIVRAARRRLGDHPLVEQIERTLDRIGS